MAVVDFTRQTWGHAIHFPSKVVKPRGLWERLRQWWTGERVHSVMCHCSVVPRPGDTVRFKIAEATYEVELVAVSWFTDPRDMYTLYFRVPKVFLPKEFRCDHRSHR